MTIQELLLDYMIKKKLTQRIKLGMKPSKKKNIKAESGKDLRVRLNAMH